MLLGRITVLWNRRGAEKKPKRNRREAEEEHHKLLRNTKAPSGTTSETQTVRSRHSSGKTKRPKQKENGRCGLEAHTPGGDGKVRTVLPTLAFKGFK